VPEVISNISYLVSTRKKEDEKRQFSGPRQEEGLKKRNLTVKRFDSFGRRDAGGWDKNHEKKKGRSVPAEQ